MSLKAAAVEQCRFLLSPHYIASILLSVSFFVVKVTPYICNVMFNTCEYELREMELLGFLGCVIAVKNKKQRQSFRDFVKQYCMYSKLLCTILFARYDFLLAFGYVVCCLMHIIFLPAPSDYTGPESITYFRGPNLEAELQSDTRITWLIEFYAPWSSKCIDFAAVFSKISHDYSLSNLKFGKIDASRYLDIAKKFRVDGTTWSKQLPTVIRFQSGEETRRRPFVDSKGTVIKFSFQEEDIVRDFELKELYTECKKVAQKPKKEKKDN